MSINYFVNQAVQPLSNLWLLIQLITIFAFIVFVFFSSSTRNLTIVLIILIPLTMVIISLNSYSQRTYLQKTQSSALTAYALAQQKVFNNQGIYLNKNKLEDQFPGLKKLDKFQIKSSYSDQDKELTVMIINNASLSCWLRISTSQLNKNRSKYYWDGEECSALREPEKKSKPVNKALQAAFN
jgi:hypothetical protein